VLDRLRAGARHALLGWVTIVTRWPARVLALALLLTALALIFTVRELGIDTSTTDMISAEVPFRQSDIAFKEAFPAFRDPIVVVIDGTTPEQAERAAEDLAAALEADRAHFSAVRLPGAEPFFRTHGLLFLDVEELADLADRLAVAQPLLAALAEDPTLDGLARFVALATGEAGAALPEELDEIFTAMADVVRAQLEDRPAQFSWQRLLTPEGQTSTSRRLLLALPRLDHTSLAPAADAIEALRAHAEALGVTDAAGLELRLTGSPVLDQEELESVASGTLVAATLTTVGVTVLLIWGLGSWRLILATLVMLASGLILTAAFATLAIGRLNLISVAFAVLFVGLGVDFGIHLALRYREALRSVGDTPAALRNAVAGVGGPLSLSALCAALGFLAFAPTDYRGLAELGVIAAAGMAIAWAASLTLMPALLTLLPLLSRQAGRNRAPVRLGWIDRVKWPLLVVAGLAALGAALLLPRVAFDFNPLRLKDPESESVATFLDLAEDPATSPYEINVLAPDLARADELAARLERLELVDQAITLESFVPAEQEEKLEIVDSLAFYLGPVLAAPIDPETLSAEERRDALERLRESLAKAEGPGAARLEEALAGIAETADDGAAALAELERRLTGTLAQTLERLRDALRAAPVDLESLPGSLRAQWLAGTGEARILVRPAIPITDNADLARFARAVLAVAPAATGTPVIITEAGRAVIGAFAEASVIALVLITAVLAVVLRRLGDVLLVLAPLGLAVLFTAASTVLLDLQINFANVIVLPLLLGLGVSGALHIVMRRRQQPDEAGLLASSTPRAVLFSALTTIASFGSLAVSDHRGLASMGLLLTVAILWSLLCTLVVLPSMLVAMRPRRR